jgi:hypothetical protein
MRVPLAYRFCSAARRHRFQPNGGSELNFTQSSGRRTLFSGETFLVSKASAHTAIIVAAGAKVLCLMEPLDALARQLGPRTVLFTLGIDREDPLLKVRPSRCKSVAAAAVVVVLELLLLLVSMLL